MPPCGANNGLPDTGWKPNGYLGTILSRPGTSRAVRLCATAILIRKGQARYVVVTADEPICWACMAKHYAYPGSCLPQFIIN